MLLSILLVVCGVRLATSQQENVYQFSPPRPWYLPEKIVDTDHQFPNFPFYENDYFYAPETSKPPPTTKMSYGTCYPSPYCPRQGSNEYPRPDGACNNRNNPRRGSAEYPLKRLLPAAYADGRSAPRVASDGRKLPSARLVHTYMEDAVPRVSSKTSHMVPWWGQYIVHDMVNTPKFTKVDGSDLDCNCDNPHPDCYNIDIPRNDIQFLQAGKTCLAFSRSKSTPNIHCDNTVREHINTITAYIDAGTVYGNSQEQLDDLVDQSSDIGELKVFDKHQHDHLKSLLPLTDVLTSPYAKKMECKAIHRPKTLPCMAAGDVRANENTGLTGAHTAFLRLHNIIVRDLKDKNSHWAKDKIFQETRRIMAAIHQIITYKEFLPVVIGSTNMRRYGLDINTHGFSNYDPSYDATISDAFTTAAFRYGHVMVNRVMSRPSGNWYTQNGSPIPVKDSLFNNEPVYNKSAGGIDSIMRGLVADASLVTDNTMGDDMSNFLFAEKGKFGNDLMAINIQRGRDHGLPGYNFYREFCGLKKAHTFMELNGIERRLQIKLQSIYKHPNDIDLFVGGLAETPVTGAAVGPTFACIIAHQFRDIKVGDRFWFDNGGEHQIFTTGQLSALRKYTLSRFLCDTTFGTYTMQPKPMLLSSVAGNSRRLCSSFPKLDLTAWKEEVTKEPHGETYWSEWIDQSFPTYNNGFDESEGATVPGSCTNPTAIEALTLGGIPAGETGEIFVSLNVANGLVCQGNHQYNGRCSDYKVRFLCTKGSTSSHGTWTDWVSSRNDYGDDAELLADVQNLPGFCNYPIDMEVREHGQFHPTTNFKNKFVIKDKSYGLVCRQIDQPYSFPMCLNYEVRYLCP